MNNLLAGLLIIATTTNLLAQDKFVVYDDEVKNSQPSGKMGAWGGSGLSDSYDCTVKPATGSKCMKFVLSGEEAWNGIYFQASGTWRDATEDKSKFIDLSPYKYLTFQVRTDTTFTLEKAGIGEGSETNISEKGIPLTSEWKRVVFELGGLDLKSINGLFLLVFTGKGTIYVDDVYYTTSLTTNENDLVFKRRSTPPNPEHYHIYTDKWENGIPSGYMGDADGASIDMQDAWRENAFEGPKCIKFTIKEGIDLWRGLDVQYAGAWNVTLDDETKLPDLSDYTKLVFYARTDDDEYIITSVGFAQGGGFEEGVNDSYLYVTKEWKKYTIPITQASRKRVNTLFRIMLQTGTLYLDEIHLEKGGSIADHKKSRVRFIRK